MLLRYRKVNSMNISRNLKGWKIFKYGSDISYGIAWDNVVSLFNVVI